MSLTIPVWVLWVFGVLGGIALLFCAAIGFMFMWGWRDR